MFSQRSMGLAKGHMGHKGHAYGTRGGLAVGGVLLLTSALRRASGTLRAEMRDAVTPMMPRSPPTTWAALYPCTHALPLPSPSTTQLHYLCMHPPPRAIASPSRASLEP
jgi:hypothetical protein